MTDHRFEPDQGFIDNLEWQLRREGRRLDRFEATARPRWRLARTAAVVAISLAVGFATATAAQQAESRAQRRLLLMQAEGRAEIAELQVQAALERVDLALSTEPELMAGYEGEWLEMAVREAERGLDLARLELAEVSASGAAVRDDLTAPRVDGRDFVSERKALEVERIASHVRLMRQRIDAIHQTGEGEAWRAEIERAELDLRRMRREREHVEWQISLRASFLAGEMGADEVLRAERAARAQGRLEVAESAVHAARTMLDAAHQEVAGGALSLLVVRDAEIQLAEAELDLKLARLELRVAGGEAR